MKINWTHLYEPSPDFVKDLKVLDENLMVFWDAEDHDWVIVRRGLTGYHEIGHYKTLDNRVFKSLDDGDLWKTTPKKLDEYLTEYQEKIDKEKRNDVHENAMELGRRAYVDGGVREHKTQF